MAHKIVIFDGKILAEDGAIKVVGPNGDPCDCCDDGCAINPGPCWQIGDAPDLGAVGKCCTQYVAITTSETLKNLHPNLYNDCLDESKLWPDTALYKWMYEDSDGLTGDLNYWGFKTLPVHNQPPLLAYVRDNKGQYAKCRFIVIGIPTVVGRDNPPCNGAFLEIKDSRLEGIRRAECTDSGFTEGTAFCLSDRKALCSGCGDAPIDLWQCQQYGGDFTEGESCEGGICCRPDGCDYKMDQTVWDVRCGFPMPPECEDDWNNGRPRPYPLNTEFYVETPDVPFTYASFCGTFDDDIAIFEPDSEGNPPAFELDANGNLVPVVEPYCIMAKRFDANGVLIGAIWPNEPGIVPLQKFYAYVRNLGGPWSVVGQWFFTCVDPTAADVVNRCGTDFPCTDYVIPLNSPNIGKRSMNKSRGLGDMVSDALSSVGITKERVSKAVGGDCGCAKRQEKLNKIGQKIGIGRKRKEKG